MLGSVVSCIARVTSGSGSTVRADNTKKQSIGDRSQAGLALHVQICLGQALRSGPCTLFQFFHSSCQGFELLPAGDIEASKRALDSLARLVLQLLPAGRQALLPLLGKGPGFLFGQLTALDQVSHHFLELLFGQLQGCRDLPTISFGPYRASCSFHVSAQSRLWMFMCKRLGARFLKRALPVHTLEAPADRNPRGFWSSPGDSGALHAWHALEGVAPMLHVGAKGAPDDEARVDGPTTRSAAISVRSTESVHLARKQGVGFPVPPCDQAWRCARCAATYATMPSSVVSFA